MKRLQKILILFSIFLIASMVILNYIFSHVTPRTLGQAIFPLQNKWETCVKENIQTISADNSGKIFAITSTALTAFSQETGKLA